MSSLQRDFERVAEQIFPQRTAEPELKRKADETIPTPKKRRTQPKTKPKANKPYKFNFGKFRGKTVEQVYLDDPFYIEEFILAKRVYETKPDLENALRKVSEDFLQDHDRLRRYLEPVFTYEAMTERGPMRMNERSQFGVFFEATDRKAILAAHQNIPDAKVVDFNETFEIGSHSPFVVAFTATVVRAEEELADHGYGAVSGNLMRLLPCGWPWDAALEDRLSCIKYGKWGNFEPKELKEMVYRSYRFCGNILYDSEKPGNWAGSLGLFDLGDLVPVEPNNGCCFRALGIVKSVEEREVVLHLEKEGTRYRKGWEKDITVRLAEGVETPEEGRKCVLKGTVTPFTPTYKGLKFRAEICEKLKDEQKP